MPGPPDAVAERRAKADNLGYIPFASQALDVETWRRILGRLIVRSELFED